MYNNYIKIIYDSTFTPFLFFSVHISVTWVNIINTGNALFIVCTNRCRPTVLLYMPCEMKYNEKVIWSRISNYNSKQKARALFPVNYCRLVNFWYLCVPYVLFILQKIKEVKEKTVGSCLPKSRCLEY